MEICKFDRQNKTHLIALTVAVLVTLIVIGLLVYFLFINKETAVFGGRSLESFEGPEEEYQRQALTLHNEYRKKHHAPPLTLNKELNTIAKACAQYYTEIDTIDHSCKHKIMKNGKKAGENLYMSWGKQYDLVAEAKAGTTSWYDEIKDYDFTKDHPEPNPPGPMVGHFTALVWKDSRELGIGYAKREEKDSQVIVAMYYPHGNMRFNDKYLYKENVLPE